MTAFTASRDPPVWTTGSASQPEPSALVLKKPSCYCFRVLDPRVFAIISVTVAAVTIGSCSHI